MTLFYLYLSFYVLKFSILFLVLILLTSGNIKASASETQIIVEDSTLVTDFNTESTSHQMSICAKKKIKLITLLQQATVENKKVTAAVIALTLGMLGVHRIYLGTAPYIPAVYLFTFGGGFFVLPLIDLVMILTTKDISKFENNSKLLMWTKE